MTILCLLTHFSFNVCTQQIQYSEKEPDQKIVLGCCKPASFKHKENETIAEGTANARIDNSKSIYHVYVQVPRIQPSDFGITHRVINVAYALHVS